MKLLLLAVAALLAVSKGREISEVPRDNSQYVDGVSRYIWMNDGEGDQLVDLQEKADEEVLATRNGANNRYFLFTRQNPTTAQEIVLNNANSIWNSNFVASRPTKIVSHGWLGSVSSGINAPVTSAFLAAMDCNVIVLDWQATASANYVTAVFGVPGVGQFLGNFLVWLMDTTNGNWNNVHLVGYSLGAHVVGNAGRTAGNRVSRVTGLDPAGPLWTTNSNRLAASDGQYVECIHTDGGRQGILTPSGDTDFYPNGGTFHPGCESTDSGCSHARSYEFFAASVRFNHLIGRLCTNLSQAQSVGCTGLSLHMGNSILTKRGNGIYGLTTGSAWPY